MNFYDFVNGDKREKYFSNERLTHFSLTSFLSVSLFGCIGGGEIIKRFNRVIATEL